MSYSVGPWIDGKKTVYAGDATVRPGCGRSRHGLTKGIVVVPAQRPKYTPKSHRLSENNQVKVPFGVVCNAVGSVS
jgi:hypothetical protein